MFGMSMTEILMIVVLALVILGPEKLPQLAKMAGKGLREIRRATTDIRQSLEIDDIKSQLQEEFSLSKTNNAGWNRPGQFDDPYAQAAQDDLDEDDLYKPPSGPYGAEDEAEAIEDAQISHPLPPSKARTLKGAPSVTPVELEPWHDLTGVGVLIQKQSLSPVRLHTAEAITVIPVEGGVTITQDETPEELQDAPETTPSAPPNTGETHTVSPTLTAVTLGGWHDLTGVGVLIQRQTIPSAPIHLLGGVRAVSMGGGPKDTLDHSSDA